MRTEEKTDYRKTTPEVLYQMRKTVIALFKKQKSVEEIIEITDFSEQRSAAGKLARNVHWHQIRRRKLFGSSPTRTLIN